MKSSPGWIASPEAQRYSSACAAAATRCSRAAGFFGKIWPPVYPERAVEEHWEEPLALRIEIVPMEANGGAGCFVVRYGILDDAAVEGCHACDSVPQARWEKVSFCRCVLLAWLKITPKITSPFQN